MQKLRPRSPYERLGGYVHLPRLIDKAKLHRKGLLDGYNYKTVGFDKHLLAFLHLDPDKFEEAANRLDNDAAILDWVKKNGAKHSLETIEHWNETMIARHPDTAAKNSEAMLATYDVGDLEAIKKYSSITIDADGVITRFEEKPAEPKNTLAGIALYYFSRDIVPLFTTYIAAGNNPDQPGRFIQWLYQRKRVKTYQIGGTWFDIGSKETLEEANQIFAQFVAR